MIHRSSLGTLVLFVVACVLGAAAPSAVQAICGDGVLDAGEFCDDGNVVGGDCCDAACATPCTAGAGCGTLCFDSLVCSVPAVGNPQCQCSVGACPLGRGEYTLAVTGGTTTVGSTGPMPQALGGMTTLLVGDPNAACVHGVVIPVGGYTVPLTCVFGVITAATFQTGCGIGRLDSDGGADFTITEVGDTSSPVACGLPHAGCTPGGDPSNQLDVTVGDASADGCAPGTTGNLITSIPVATDTWVEFDGSCPAADGTFDPGLGDTFLATVALTIDGTTDASTAGWVDLDPDGCFLAGFGPATVPTSTGTCIDYGAGTVSTAASSTIASTTPPDYDITFTSLAIQTFTLTGPNPGASCFPAPPISLGGGTTMRCIP